MRKIVVALIFTVSIVMAKLGKQKPEETWEQQIIPIESGLGEAAIQEDNGQSSRLKMLLEGHGTAKDLIEHEKKEKALDKKLESKLREDLKNFDQLKHYQNLKADYYESTSSIFSTLRKQS